MADTETWVDIRNAIKGHGEEMKEIDKQVKKLKINNKSIIKRTKESIFYFPVYISSSIRINEAHVVAKLYERVYADFVQNVISQPDNQFVDYSELEDMRFLKKFHVNAESAQQTYDAVASGRKFVKDVLGKPLSFTEETINRSCYHACKINDRVMVEFMCIAPSGKTYDMIAEHERMMQEPLSGFSFLQEAQNNPSTGISANNKVKYRDYDPNSDNDKKINKFYDVNGKEYDRKQINFTDPNADNYVDKFKVLDTTGAGTEVSIGPAEFNKVGNRYQQAGRAAQLLKDTDCKKINGMLPYSIIATFKVKNTPGVSWTRDVIEVQIGIKTVLHIINPKDLIDEVKPIIMGGQKSLQKVRYKTGEIKFKDYFFGLTDLKKGAAQLYSKSKRWLGSLKRLGEFGKMYKSALKDPVTAVTKDKGIPIPNATLVLSALDVDNIKLGCGIDLMNLKYVNKLAKQLFLITFVIVDSSSGVIRSVYPNEQDDWDNMSIASIEDLVSKSSNADFMKELKRTVNR